MTMSISLSDDSVRNLPRLSSVSALRKAPNVPNTKMTAKKEVLSSFEAMCVGAIGGTIETTLQMPLVTWKICVQEGRAYPQRFFEWYRGVGINAGSLAPITALQCFANSLFERIITWNHSKSLSDTDRLVCSASAGALSGIIYGPVDLLVIQQQKFVASLPRTLQMISNRHGGLRIFRGLTACMGRESLYTMGYLGVAPVVTAKLLETDSMPFFAESKVFTSIVGAMVGGTFGAILTHPIDTCKTCVQSDLTAEKYINTRSTMKQLYQTGRVSILFKGCLPRTLRLCGACFVISQVRENMLRLKLEA